MCTCSLRSKVFFCGKWLCVHCRKQASSMYPSCLDRINKHLLLFSSIELFSFVILTAFAHHHHHPWDIPTTNIFLLSYSFPLLRMCIGSYHFYNNGKHVNAYEQSKPSCSSSNSSLTHIVGAVDLCVTGDVIHDRLLWMGCCA